MRQRCGRPLDLLDLGGPFFAEEIHVNLSQSSSSNLWDQWRYYPEIVGSRTLGGKHTQAGPYWPHLTAGLVANCGPECWVGGFRGLDFSKKQFLEGYLRPCKLESQFLLSWRTKPSISPKRNHHDSNWLIYGQSIYECGMVSLSRAFSSFSQWTSLPKCSMNMNVFTNDHVLWTNPPNVGNYGAYGFIL